MATISAGYSPTFKLAAGQRLAFSAGGAGLALVLRGASTESTAALGPTPVNIGPFPEDRSICVSAQAALTYRITGPGSTLAAAIIGANKPGFRPALNAISQCWNQRVDIGVQSMSVGMGVSATGGSTYDAATMELWNTQAMYPLFGRYLCAALGGIASTASQSVVSGSASPRTTNPLFVVGGGAAAAASSWGAGPGGWRIALTAAAHTVALKAIGTSIKVCGLTDAVGRVARWSAPSVAGGVAQNAAASTNQPNLNAAAFWYEWVITGVTPGETVTLMGPTAGLYTIDQIDPDYRTDAGITIHRQCLTGAPAVEISAAYLDNTDTQGPNAAWLGSTQFIQNTRSDQAASMSVRPAAMDLVIAHSEVNDLNTWEQAGTNWGYTLADHERHMTNYLAWHAARGIPVLEVFGPMRDPSYLVGTRPYDQIALVNTLKAAIDRSPNGAWFDGILPFGADGVSAYAAQASILNDQVHENQGGHDVKAHLLTSAVLASI